MKRKHRRLLLLAVCLAGLGAAVALTLTAFQDNLVFFVSPADVAAKAVPGRTFRLGGLVAPGSVEKLNRDGKPVAAFAVTDGEATVKVEYTGILPDLFREGQGVVALGAMRPGGVFVASEVLAKHDEKYMPAEVTEALKKRGQWNTGTAPAKTGG
jgi:cytochrome c-type biogenesis protein CcmE